MSDKRPEKRRETTPKRRQDEGRPAGVAGAATLPKLDIDEERENDVLFKLQMGIANFAYAHWKKGLYAAGAILGGALVWGLWTTHVQNAQREAQAALARADLLIPKDDQLAVLGLARPDGPSEAERESKLKEAASKYEEVGANSTGTAAAMAWVKAARVRERLGQTEPAKADWQKAYDIDTKGIIGYAAGAGLANAKASGGDVDGAAAVWRHLADTQQGFLKQQALLSLAELYSGAGRKDEADKVLKELSTQFPNSPLPQRVSPPMAQVGGAG